MLSRNANLFSILASSIFTIFNEALRCHTYLSNKSLRGHLFCTYLDRLELTTDSVNSYVVWWTSKTVDPVSNNWPMSWLGPHKNNVDQKKPIFPFVPLHPKRNHASHLLPFLQFLTQLKTDSSGDFLPLRCFLNKFWLFLQFWNRHLQHHRQQQVSLWVFFLSWGQMKSSHLFFFMMYEIIFPIKLSTRNMTMCVRYQ